MQIDFLVEAGDSGGSVTAFECSVPADEKMPVPHSHDAFEETIYGLEGTTTWTVDGEAREVGPGECICIERGHVHGFQNHGSTDARFLAVATPGVFGPAYFEDLAAVVAEAQGPPDPAAIVEVMRRHGLTPAPPVAA
jgi:quercetin dioxygenase-like cupin family protein